MDHISDIWEYARTMANKSLDLFADDPSRLSGRDILYTSIIGVTAIFGLLSNGGAMYILSNGGKLGQAFQQLCFSHCVSNFTALIFFLLYCCPMILLQTEFSHQTAIAKLIGGFMVALWDVSVYSHLMSSINRLIVITWPVKSREFLRQRNSTIMISIVWFMGLLHFLPYLMVSDCYIVFFSDIYLWAFSDNYCGYVLGKVLDFWTGVSVFAIILVFDLWTLYRIGKLRGATGKRARKQDVKFFVQACIQFLLFVVKLCTFYFISAIYTGDLVGNHAEVFFTTSFVWELCHCMDGVVLIPFHYGDYARKQTGIASIGGNSVAPSQFNRISTIPSSMKRSQAASESEA